MPEPSLSLSKAPIVEAVVDIDCEMERDAQAARSTVELLQEFNGSGGGLSPAMKAVRSSRASDPWQVALSRGTSSDIDLDRRS